jgi:hypothetical protein
MHLKSYRIDGRLLRTGAAKLSASSLTRQDNDLIVIESTAARTVSVARLGSIPDRHRASVRPPGKSSA